MTFFALYFYAIWLAYVIKPWNVIDSIISFSLAKKMMQFSYQPRAENSAIRE